MIVTTINSKGKTYELTDKHSNIWKRQVYSQEMCVQDSMTVGS